METAHALNLQLGWVLVLAGMLAGAALGVGFHGERFLGGYTSWRRRLVRLGHVALVALGGLNVLFALTPCAAAQGGPARVAALAWLVGAVAMPTVCFLTAWRRPFRHLFALPVTALLTAVVATLVHLA